MWGSDLMKKEQEIKETLKLYYDLLTTKTIQQQLQLLQLAILNITQNQFDMREITNPITDRGIIEAIQEAYGFIYCMINGLKYETFDIREHLKKDRYFDWIANYKMEYFADEIFQELGLQLVEKNKKGFVVKSEVPKQKLN